MITKKKPNYKDIKKMVKNCTWLEDIGYHIFLQLAKQKMIAYPQGP
jgi:hypothetical protein